MNRPADANSLLHEVDFLVVDVETTGLSAARGDRICEIGAVKIRGGEIRDSFGTLINPGRPIAPAASAVNHITDAMVSRAPRFADALPSLLPLLRGSVIVGYNAEFDLSFLRNEFLLAGRQWENHRMVDTLALARKLLPGLRKYPQEFVAGIVGLAFPVKHRALEDATMTATLFTLFTSMLRSHGVEQFADVLRPDLITLLCAKRRALIDTALRNGNNLWIKYLSPSANGISSRVITPIGCSTAAGNVSADTMVVGFCHTAREERTFRLDRILDLRLIHTLPRVSE
ncbi:MAG TPA: exonuclease domain-containing protein [Bacteroidota bacterium]|nr:exonuclease domain-containing protein [Bacteroidota bacterium]